MFFVFRLRWWPWIISHLKFKNHPVCGLNFLTVYFSCFSLISAFFLSLHLIFILFGKNHFSTNKEMMFDSIFSAIYSKSLAALCVPLENQNWLVEAHLRYWPPQLRSIYLSLSLIAVCLSSPDSFFIFLLFFYIFLFSVNKQKMPNSFPWIMLNLYD